MVRLDEIVLQALAQKVFTPSSVAIMLKELKDKVNKSSSAQEEELRLLKKELDANQQATSRLYEAFEKGLLPMDETLGGRVQGHKARQ